MTSSRRGIHATPITAITEPPSARRPTELENLAPIDELKSSVGIQNK